MLETYELINKNVWSMRKKDFPILAWIDTVLREVFYPISCKTLMSVRVPDTEGERENANPHGNMFCCCCFVLFLNKTTR